MNQCNVTSNLNKKKHKINETHLNKSLESNQIRNKRTKKKIMKNKTPWAMGKRIKGHQIGHRK